VDLSRPPEDLGVVVAVRLDLVFREHRLLRAEFVGPPEQATDQEILESRVLAREELPPLVVENQLVEEVVEESSPSGGIDRLRAHTIFPGRAFEIVRSELKVVDPAEQPVGRIHTELVALQNPLLDSDREDGPSVPGQVGGEFDNTLITKVARHLLLGLVAGQLAYLTPAFQTNHVMPVFEFDDFADFTDFHRRGEFSQLLRISVVDWSEQEDSATLAGWCAK
jgi:hypothetical protein